MASQSASVPPQFRNPIIHDAGPSAYPGAYRVTDAALKAYGIAREYFGTTEVLNADGTTFRVKDYQYALAGGSVGMTFLPISDTGASVGPDGTTVYGSVLVDEFLRREMALQPDDQIYALIYFIHPELNRGSVVDFSKNDKIELGITHMGAYLGLGRTSNSPPLYHNRGWAVKGEVGNAFGYPANVAILSLAGVDQAVLNKNLYLVDTILNEGVRFPIDYKNSQFRPADINTALMFYRDWIGEAEYLRTDSSWFTYCAAHKTLVANVALNLPHNLQAFKDVYGASEGADFFARFCQFHFATFGTEFTPDLQTDFEPLWRQQGLTPDQIRPLTLPEYTAYDAAFRADDVAGFTGFKPLPPDVGTPWAPQATADLVYDFVQNYADFIDAGAITMSATIFGFVGPITERTGIGKVEYLLRALPIAQSAIYGHARIYAAVSPAPTYHESAYYAATFAALYTAFGGKDADVAAALARVAAMPAVETLWERVQALISGDLLPEVMAWAALVQVRDGWDAIMAGGTVPIDEAYDVFMTSIQARLNIDRHLHVHSPTGIQFNTPPAIGHLIGVGMYPSNPIVTLRPVLTVMNYTELETNPT